MRVLGFLLLFALVGALFHFSGRSGGLGDGDTRQDSGSLHSDDPRRISGERGIVLLYAEWCGYCRKLRADFKRAGLRYTGLDVDTLEGDRAMQALRARGVPVTVIGQNVVHGYDTARLQTYLSPLGYRVY
ncbi:glutaredoxin family protein [Lysobacter pythonis]|uniref:Glutaredoxin family protein n=1 Tax=Solilutibacter pythonis TaxID=2483112 RepID=A0A3M2I327_9GAMM|nr:glutaredoxin domain-containing protein [Lysobacter pythonis]RMH94390.1 glutaredoxin family protein [Lysobacter pythonis]